MKSFLTGAVVSLSLSGCLADWNGAYDDPIYGGEMFVCVSDIDGQLHGQGTFSRIGYMRGTINADDLFTGNFWLQGWEGLHGSFSLSLSGSSYSGNFTQLPGITYSIAGAKTSSSTPTDLECQRSDDYLLTTTEYYSSTGTYVHVGPDNDLGIISNSIVEAEAGVGTTLGSYQYVFSSTGELVHGTEYSASFLNGQVKTGRWSEAGPDAGLNMYIAKNDTHHYTSWWFINRMAEFDYALTLEEDYEGHSMMMKVDPEELPGDSRDATENVCLELFTEEDETNCYSIDSGGDDDDNVSAGVVVSGMVFSVFAFLAACGFGAAILMELRKRGGGGASASSGTAATKNAMHSGTEKL
mmetsp:Transcript_2098/g.3967  ORF Transcript_2098/g.3967 Transcript_2098/m.3967 type:complete len:354 (-) Transcript_2098:87-1148(-)